jgi:hypothetical protein
VVTVSEHAVLLAIRRGASTVDEIQQVTGAARWWVEMNVFELVGRGALVADNHGTSFHEPQR